MGPTEKISSPLLVSRRQYGNGWKPALNYSNLCVFITGAKGWPGVGGGGWGKEVKTNKQKKKPVYYSKKVLDSGFSSVLAYHLLYDLEQALPPLGLSFIRLEDH